MRRLYQSVNRRTALSWLGMLALLPLRSASAALRPLGALSTEPVPKPRIDTGPPAPLTAFSEPRILRSPLVPLSVGPRKLSAGFETYVYPGSEQQLVAMCKRTRLIEGDDELSNAELAQVIKQFYFVSVPREGGQMVPIIPEVGDVGVHLEVPPGEFETLLVLVLHGGEEIRVSAFESIAYPQA